MHARDSVAERTYAGVLGKIIGVYLGRPVEGWTYEAIDSRFGTVTRYVHEAVGAPLVVADDDISGTFAFFRALEEHGFPSPLTPAHVATTWQNQIVADKTILWWGGLGRSTEHTAWLRLKAGIPAPQSGSIALNGRTVAEQIGAQIFIDAFAMACPGDPERAAGMIRAAASVSHDGLAVEAAAFLGALEALAFEVRELDPLFDAALPVVRDDRLLRLIDDVRTLCTQEREWRRARAWIDDHHGYGRYGGNCPMGTNHAAVLMALLMGGDDFGHSLAIAVSAGWDTDCNAGNVGCLNGIRLGLDAIPVALRVPVADRLLIVSSEGGRCVSDAVQETRAILRAAAIDRREPPLSSLPRFAFDFRGSRQGFERCPLLTPEQNVAQIVESDSNGLAIALESLAPGQNASVSTPVFLVSGEIEQGYSTLCSPTLYPTQTVVAHIHADEGCLPASSLHAWYVDRTDVVQRVQGPAVALRPGRNELRWQLPHLEGMPIVRVGLSLTSLPGRGPLHGKVHLIDMDWMGAPVAFEQARTLAVSSRRQPTWLRAWVSSARHFAGDGRYTYVVSHPEDGGIVTIGTPEWADYTVASHITFSLHESGGLVARSNGHRRYYAALLSGHKTASIVQVRDDEVHVLAREPFAYEEEREYALSFSACGNRLSMCVDGQLVLEAEGAGEGYPSGGAGFVVDTGTLLASGFSVRS